VADSLHGLGVSPGVASGPVARMAEPVQVPSDVAPGADLDVEVGAAEQALDAVAAGLQERADRAAKDAAEVLAAQVLMAQDPALRAKVVSAVRDGKAAVTAVVDSFAEYRDLLAAAGPYLAERVADLDDLRNRAVAVLLGVAMPGVPDPGHPYVLVAEDLAPADTATLDAAKVLAIVTVKGGPTSHTAILAKSLGIPAVVACAEAAALVDGQTVLVDGEEGSIVVEPDTSTLQQALDAQQRQHTAMATSSGPGRTADGHGVQLLVNIAGDKDLEGSAAADAEGVGLFRTEFLFLERPDAPSVDEQRAAYARVFAAFIGRKVVVRTLDAGADKPLAFVTTPDEPNPALGVRGLRTSRRHPELLDGQLQAIAAAAQGSGAEVWVMAPMVATAGEAAEFAGLARSHGIGMAGVMVEVPAAAIRARHLAAVCDFLSLGTNDLSQYTYAADRMSGELADLLDPWQPALLELVRSTALAGQQQGRPVGVCGEAASDPLLALVLVGLGVTSLSMAPVMVAGVRASLAQHTLDECRGLAERAIEAEDGRGARAAVRASTR
jgi:phosphotransferase system enzyme I (PtsI)